MLKRTPPNTPTAQLFNSEPNLASHKDVEQTEMAKVTQRKRKRQEDESLRLDKMENIMADMKTMFSEFVEQQTKQNAKIDSLQSALDEIKSQNLIIKTQNSEIRTQNDELQKSMDFLSNKYDDAIQKIDKMQKECVKNREVIKALESKVDYLERNSKASSIELRNIPSTTPENKEILTNMIQNIGVAVSRPVTKSEIKEIFRTKSRSDAEGKIIVEFLSSSTKEDILKSIKKYNKDNKENRLNTTHLRTEGPKKPIYVSEVLTTKARRLYYLCREFKNTSSYEHCWTSNGKVYLREKDGLPSRLINSEEDICLLRKEK